MYLRCWNILTSSGLFCLASSRIQRHLRTRVQVMNPYANSSDPGTNWGAANAEDWDEEAFLKEMGFSFTPNQYSSASAFNGDSTGSTSLPSDSTPVYEGITMNAGMTTNDYQTQSGYTQQPSSMEYQMIVGHGQPDLVYSMQPLNSDSAIFDAAQSYLASPSYILPSMRPVFPSELVQTQPPIDAQAAYADAQARFWASQSMMTSSQGNLPPQISHDLHYSPWGSPDIQKLQGQAQEVNPGTPSSASVLTRRQNDREIPHSSKCPPGCWPSMHFPKPHD